MHDLTHTGNLKKIKIKKYRDYKIYYKTLKTKPTVVARGTGTNRRDVKVTVRDQSRICYPGKVLKVHYLRTTGNKTQLHMKAFLKVYIFVVLAIKTNNGNSMREWILCHC